MPSNRGGTAFIKAGLEVKPLTEASGVLLKHTIAILGHTIEAVVPQLLMRYLNGYVKGNQVVSAVCRVEHEREKRTTLMASRGIRTNSGANRLASLAAALDHRRSLIRHVLDLSRCAFVFTFNPCATQPRLKSHLHVPAHVCTRTQVLRDIKPTLDQTFYST